MADDAGFLSRWSQRKAQARRGPVAESAPVPAAQAPEPAPAAAPPVPPRPVSEAQPAPAAPPLPTLADVAQLHRDSDFSRFVVPGVDEGVKQAAMKKLFADPHFNVMDGLDTYIDDYGKPDPISLAMLRQMAQAKALRLFEHEDEEVHDVPQSPDPLIATRDPEPESTSDDDPDLRLQQDHAAGWSGPGQGAGA
ncbi:MAG TPA: DUF3306 domain-containing protein [Burkholderiaceae bacterium]|nr:DUF3306 domain-containing protein [Burkholderiaceae bacterium]